jgi:hypothetical protein
MEKLKCEPAVGPDRCGSQPLVTPQVLLEADDRYGVDIGPLAHTSGAQELQQLAHVESFATPRLRANGSMSTPTATPVLLDVDLAEIGQRHSALREPTVERQCMPCLDIDDTRRVLLVDQ